jgi:tetratricopeptide (TPR) repeat protein
MDREPAAPARQRLDGYYRTGLLLAPYFYEALEVFEGQEEGIRDYFTEMAEAIDVGKERTRFQTTFRNIPAPIRQSLQAEVPVAAPAPVANPARDLLKEGETALNSGDAARARSAFEKVLTDYDRTNGAAFYGLALIARREGDVDRAQEFFENTTRSDSADPSMKVWAYIYLAQLFDLGCERERALEYYEQAVKIGDNTRNAQDVARQGIAAPYGDACR